MQIPAPPAHLISPTSKASMLLKLAMANPSIKSSSCELDSRRRRLGGLTFLAAAAGWLLGLGQFWLAFSLPGLPSRSEADEGLWLGRSRPPGSLLRTRSRWERDFRLCLIFPSMAQKRPEAAPFAKKKSRGGC